jgi:2-oxoglutarate dehydrogenase E1 component
MTMSDPQSRPTALSGVNAEFLEALYQQYLEQPGAFDAEWQQFFANLPQLGTNGGALARIDTQDERDEPARRLYDAPQSTIGDKQAAVFNLINNYRAFGHTKAQLDPLGQPHMPGSPDLSLAFFGLNEADLDQEFSTGTLVGPPKAKLRDIWAHVNQTYCGHVGVEYMAIRNHSQRRWLQEAMEGSRNTPRFDAETKKQVLTKLVHAEHLEKFLHTKFVGQKRFSLEGGDSMIPLLDDLIQSGGQQGVEECVIGMAHRGRLNVLVNLLGKAPSVLFSEFEGKYDIAKMQGSGDVKYHKGFSADLRTPGGNVHVALAFNPSHLEVVNPVVEGSVRARQERRGDQLGTRVVPILIHGDSAFAGQGVVMETLQLSQARGYFTGGTIHIAINNQVGFTTSDVRDTRSTMYCSDIAKMLEAPIFHVNGDDPEAVVFTTRLALAYRQRFHKDVVIDLVCYRRLGHNEADEPAATQPVMYAAIRQHPTTRKLYADRLVADGVMTQADVEAYVEKYRAGLDAGAPQAHASLGMVGNKYTIDWSKYLTVDWTTNVDGGISRERIAALGKTLTTVPAGIKLHPRVQQVVTNRVKMLAGEQPLDWGCAETLAYASLLEDCYAVRLSGQDVGRGTFFHRHAVWHDQNGAAPYIPLQHVAERQPRFQVIDSVLSEEAVMGFEYGYATTDPGTLVIWEGQFGDFANGAQVIIDQFIASGEAKWARYCGLTLFLPHGYEGQGPEHSSARLERFLQLCAENNMQVCVPSTPAQMYHMLRRQMLRPFRKPLIVMTPKSLLRHELSVSPLEDLTYGSFANIIDEADVLEPAGVTRIVLCSGKVYFDLLKARRATANKSVVLVRVEQLYPFAAAEYEDVLRRYPNAREVVWCQEEPQNQGAWYQIRHRLERPLVEMGLDLLYAGRAHAAAPATGIAKVHDVEQARLIEAALTAPARARVEQKRKLS